MRTTYGDFITNLYSKTMDDIMSKYDILRQNMPLNFINYVGNNVKDNSDKSAAFTNQINKISDIITNEVTKNIKNAVDDIAIDFIKHRLPPIKISKTKQYTPKTFSNNDNIGLKSTNYIRLTDGIQNETMNDDSDDDDSDGNDSDDDEIIPIKMETIIGDKVNEFIDDNDGSNEERVLLYTCMKNNIKSHCIVYQNNTNMDEISQPISFPLKCKPIITKLIKTHPNNIKYSDLILFCKNNNIEINSCNNVLNILNYFELLL